MLTVRINFSGEPPDGGHNSKYPGCCIRMDDKPIVNMFGGPRKLGFWDWNQDEQ